MKRFWVLALLLAASPARAVSIAEDMPPEMRAAVQEALDFLAAIQGGLAPESPRHSQEFGSIGGRNYIAYLEKTVREIIPGECGPKGCAVLARIYGPDQIQITPSFPKVSVVRRANVLLHESKHFQLPDFGDHVKCPDPFVDSRGQDIVSVATRAPIKGMQACDKDAQGSYGLDFVFLSNLAAGASNISVQDRAEAEFWAEQSLHRVLKGKEALVEDARGAPGR